MTLPPRSLAARWRDEIEPQIVRGADQSFCKLTITLQDFGLVEFSVPAQRRH